MDPARFDEARCHHSEVLAAIEALEAAVRGARPLQEAVADYLAFHQARLMPLMRQEETWLEPLIAQHLPSEVMPASLLRREHETIELLASALEEGLRSVGFHPRNESGAGPMGARPQAPELESDLFAAASDLCLLVRDHIRREDAVLRPLLERLAENKGACP